MAIVILENKANINCNDLLNEIIREADLPSGKVLLLLNNSKLIENALGFCIPKILLPYMHGCLLDYYDYKWDCGIAISSLVSDLFIEFPAFFTFIVGHEFGHAYTCLSNIELHIHCCLISKYIVEASDGIVCNRNQLPQENIYDKFGIYLSERIYGRKKLNSDIVAVLNRFGDLEHYRSLLELKGSNNFDELRNDLISLSIPYKTKLIELWKNAVQKAKENKTITLAELINDFDSLFIV